MEKRPKKLQIFAKTGLNPLLVAQRSFQRHGNNQLSLRRDVPGFIERFQSWTTSKPPQEHPINLTKIHFHSQLNLSAIKKETFMSLTSKSPKRTLPTIKPINKTTSVRLSYLTRQQKNDRKTEKNSRKFIFCSFCFFYLFEEEQKNI